MGIVVARFQEYIPMPYILNKKLKSAVYPFPP
jgi:hypothetical protein